MLGKAIRKFGARAGSIEVGSPVDRRAHLLYALLGLWLLVCVAALASSQFTIGSRGLVIAFVGFCWVGVSGLLARRYGHPRVAICLETFAIPPIIGSLAFVSSVFMAAISGDFVDPGLEAVDRALGFDWKALFDFYVQQPMLADLSRTAYYSFALQLSFIPLLALAFGRTDTVWTYLLAYLLAVLATIAIFPMFPAIGPYIRHGIKMGELPAIAGDFPWQWKFGGWIEDLQHGRIHDMAKVPSGLAEMPSFHAAAGIIFIWASREIKFLWLPIFLLNIGMIFAALIIGGHYLIDILVGSALGMAAYQAARIVVEGAGRARPVPNPLATV